MTRNQHYILSNLIASIAWSIIAFHIPEGLGQNIFVGLAIFSLLIALTSLLLGD